MGKPVEQKRRNQIPMNEGSKFVQGQLIEEVFLLCFLSKPEENKIMPVLEIKIAISIIKHAILNKKKAILSIGIHIIRETS